MRVSLKERVEGGTYKRYFNAQVRVQLRAIDDIYSLFKNESVLLPRGFISFYTNLIEPEVYGPERLDY